MKKGKRKSEKQDKRVKMLIEREGPERREREKNKDREKGGVQFGEEKKERGKVRRSQNTPAARAVRGGLHTHLQKRENDKCQVRIKSA